MTTLEKQIYFRLFTLPFLYSQHGTNNHHNAHHSSNPHGRIPPKTKASSATRIAGSSGPSSFPRASRAGAVVVAAAAAPAATSTLATGAAATAAAATAASMAAGAASRLERRWGKNVKVEVVRCEVAGLLRGLVSA